MAFDLDEDELEATRVKINGLPPKKTSKKDDKLFKEEDVKENDKL